MITDAEVKTLALKANDIRKTVVEMLAESGRTTGSGHTGGPWHGGHFYRAVFSRNEARPQKSRLARARPSYFEQRSHHAHSVFCDGACGIFPHGMDQKTSSVWLTTPSHPERDMLPGVETTSGPLGSGLSQAAGYAFAARMDGKNFRVFCLTSDGEHGEGNTWKARCLQANTDSRTSCR